MSVPLDRETVSLAAAVALALFAALGAYDGVYVHLVKERLPARPASYLEHGLHTARAVIFPAILATFFSGHGPLALAVTLLVADQGLEIADMAVERASRAHTAGLPSSEYVVHGAIVTARAAAIALTFALGGAASHPGPLAGVVGLLLPGSIAIALLHLGLATERGRRLLASLRGARAGV